jgi:hypothetical protein
MTNREILYRREKEESRESCVHFLLLCCRKASLVIQEEQEDAVKEIFIHPTGGGVCFVKINSNLIK